MAAFEAIIKEITVKEILWPGKSLAKLLIFSVIKGNIYTTICNRYQYQHRRGGIL